MIFDFVRRTNALSLSVLEKFRGCKFESLNFGLCDAVENSWLKEVSLHHKQLLELRIHSRNFLLTTNGLNKLLSQVNLRGLFLLGCPAVSEYDLCNLFRGGIYFLNF